jgi:hypothetical protein
MDLKNIREYISKQIIEFNDIKQLSDVFYILLSFDFDVYNKIGIKQEIENGYMDKSYNAFTYKTNIFVRTREVSTISYEAFMTLVYCNKKIKKIDNPDLDPYGEEDWGWKIEEQVENIYEVDIIATIDSLFGGDTQMFVNQMNDVGINKIVTYISENGDNCGKFIIVKYSTSDYYVMNKNTPVKIDTINGKSGHPSKLIFEEPIIFKKVELIKNLDLDPYGEEDWGWKEVKEQIGISDKELPCEFEIGDEVMLRGESDSSIFHKKIGIITQIKDGCIIRTSLNTFRSGPYKNCRYYHGKIYQVKDQCERKDGYYNIYWVTPWNMTKLNEKEPPKIKWYKKGVFESATKNGFEKGQRVMYVHNNKYADCNGYASILDGLEGTIVGFLGRYNLDIGVEFDINIYEKFHIGHNCDGYGKNNHCYWIYWKLLEPLNFPTKIKWYSKGKFEDG